MKNNYSIFVDSAGTGNWHNGSAPDIRSIEVAKKYGIDISQQKARQFSTEDFKKFHKIYAMDTQNYRDLLRLCSKEEECNKRCYYNFVNEKSPLYCTQHKKENMINITYKRCCEINCTDRACYNFSNKEETLYCFKHKKKDMINITKSKCQHTKCTQDKIYGFKNKKPQFCIDHKKENMVN